MARKGYKEAGEWNGIQKLACTAQTESTGDSGPCRYTSLDEGQMIEHVLKTHHISQSPGADEEVAESASLSAPESETKVKKGGSS